MALAMPAPGEALMGSRIDHGHHGAIAQESVARHLAHEDAALVRRLDDVGALVRHGGFRSAAECFGELRRALESHLWIEERALVPAAGDRAVVQEHEQIRLLSNEISEAISRWDQPAFRRRQEQLVALLREHHRRERKLARAASGCVGTLGAFLARAAEAEAEHRRRP